MTFKKVNCILVMTLILLVLVPRIYAKDEITFTSNRTEYFFKVSEPATIFLDVKNEYEKPIDGIMSYTISQEINMNGFKSSQSSTQSSSIRIEANPQPIALNFGASDTPMDLVLKSFSFSFKEPGKEDEEGMVTEISDITIHFVQEKNEEQEKQGKEKKESEQNKQSESQGQNGQQVEQDALQKMMDQMFNREQQQQQQQQSTTSQKLQNNQQSQDMNSLKQQMQKEMQERQEMIQEFANNLAKNPEFAKEHAQMLQQGFNLSSNNFDPENNDTGSFEIGYQNTNGTTAKIAGKMENNNITNMTKEITTPEDKAKEEEQKKKDEEKKKRRDIIISILLVLVVLAIVSYIYLKHIRKKKKDGEEEIEKIIEEKIDYRKEAHEMLKKAEELFAKNRGKDAYGKVSEAVRFYFSYKYELKKELTNTELLRYMKKNKIRFSEVQKCLNLCGLVEFAKYHTNVKDFKELLKLARKEIDV